MQWIPATKEERDAYVPIPWEPGQILDDCYAKTFGTNVAAKFPRKRPQNNTSAEPFAAKENLAHVPQETSELVRQAVPLGECSASSFGNVPAAEASKAGQAERHRLEQVLADLTSRLRDEERRRQEVVEAAKAAMQEKEYQVQRMQTQAVSMQETLNMRARQVHDMLDELKLMKAEDKRKTKAHAAEASVKQQEFEDLRTALRGRDIAAQESHRRFAELQEELRHQAEQISVSAAAAAAAAVVMKDQSSMNDGFLQSDAAPDSPSVQERFVLETRCQELEDQKETLLQSIAEEQTVRRGVETEVAEFRSRVAELEQLQVTVQAKHDEKILAYQQEIDEQIGALFKANTMAEALETYEKTNVELTATNKDLVQQHEVWTQRAEEQIAKIAELESQNAQLSTELAASAHRAEEHSAEIVCKIAEIDKLKSHNQLVSDGVMTEAQRSAQLAAVVQEFEQKIADQASQIDQQGVQAIEAGDALQGLRVSLKEQQQLCSEMNLKADHLESQVVAQAADFGEKSTEVAELKLLIQDLNEKIMVQATAATQHDDKLLEATRRIAELEQISAHERDTFARTREAYNRSTAELEGLREEHLCIVTSMEEGEREAAVVASRVPVLQQELTDSRTECIRAKEAYEKIQSQLNQVCSRSQSEFQKISGNLQAAVAKTEQQEALLAKQEQDLEKQASKGEERSAIIDAQAADIRDYAIKARDMEMRLGKLTEELSSAKVRLDSTQKSASAEVANVATMKQHAAATEAALQKEYADHILKTSTKVQQLEAELGDAHGRVQASKAELSELEEKRSAATAHAMWSRREADELGAQCSRLLAEANRLKEEGVAQKKEFEAKLEAKTAEVSATQTKLEAAQQEVQQLRTQTEEVSTVRALLADKVAKLDDEVAERVRQGARAEALECKLSAESGRRGDREALMAASLTTARWQRLVEALGSDRRKTTHNAVAAEVVGTHRRAARKQTLAFSFALMARASLVASRRAAFTAALRGAQAAAKKGQELEKELLQTQGEKSKAEAALHMAERSAAGLQEQLQQQSHELHQKSRELEAADRQQRDIQYNADVDLENEKLREQNQQLATTVTQHSEEIKQLLIENSSLSKSVDLFAGDLEKVSDRHAQLIGHTNEKQKIKYVEKLKDECRRLRNELKSSKSNVVALQSQHRLQNIAELLIEISGSERLQPPSGFRVSTKLSGHGLEPVPPLPGMVGTPQHSPQHSPLRGSTLGTSLPPQLATPGGGRGRQPALTPTPRRNALQLPSAARKMPSYSQAPVTDQEMVRKIKQQERAVERIAADFQHFWALVERAVMVDAPPQDGDAVPRFANLLNCLRAIALTKHRPAAAAATATPSTPPRYSQDELDAASPLDLGEELDDKTGDTDDEHDECQRAPLEVQVQTERKSDSLSDFLPPHAFGAKHPAGQPSSSAWFEDAGGMQN